MNVICVMMDTWRYDYIGCYGNTWIKTPNVDKMASEGALFENAYAEGVPTLPARMALFTGRYTFPFRPWQRIENNDVLLSDLLDQNGYTTALISDTLPMRYGNYMIGFQYVEWSDNSPFLATMPPRPWASWMPKARFNIYDYYKDRGDSRDAIVKQRLSRELERSLLWKSDEDSYVATTIKKAMRWLGRLEEGDRFFLWLDTWDPHEAWDPPPPFDTLYLDPNYKGPKLVAPNGGTVSDYLTEDELECVRALYAGEVSMCDKWLGMFLDKVEEVGLLDKTMIIFLSDHGTFLGDHNLITKSRCWPYEPLVHIPLIIRLPDNLRRGKRVEAFVDTTDVMPTVLDFLEVEKPKPRSTHEFIHGHSLVPLITGEADKIRNYAYMGMFKRSWAIRDEEWKYIMYGPISTGKTRSELFCLKDDPKEENNLCDESHEIVDRLELEVRRFVSKLPPPQPPNPIIKTADWLQPTR